VSCALFLPPLAEQKRIVAKVGELMKLCDELEAQLERAEADGARLFESIIAWLTTG
jgi:type I restriction enzyme, S subunit